MMIFKEQNLLVFQEIQEIREDIKAEQMLLKINQSEIDRIDPCSGYTLFLLKRSRAWHLNVIKCSEARILELKSRIQTHG